MSKIYEFPTNLWYISLSTTGSYFTSPYFWFGSIGIVASLQPSFPVSFKRYVIYFCCEIKIPYLEYETSIPRKYFSLPSSLISNSLIKHCFRSCFYFSSFPVTRISSTYTRRVVTLPMAECLMKRVWSPWLCLYPVTFITLANLPNQALGDCFSPYRAYLNLHILLTVSFPSNLGGMLI